MNQTPAVVLKSKFVMPNSEGYSNYINYINRDEATVKGTIIMDEKNPIDPFDIYYNYMDYMGDEKKEGYLFTNALDNLTKNDKEVVAQQFKIAQRNQSPMWQDVISFDNAWLEKNALYNSKKQKLNEDKIRQVVREAVGTMLKAEGMEKSAVWTAAIHYNTDNIHVHIATVEPFPTRAKANYFDKTQGAWVEQYRAKRKQGTLDKMKSKIANTILDRTEARNQITELIRGTVNDKKEKDIHLSTYRKTKKLFLKALEHMPDDRRQWQYGYKTVDNARPYIDEIADTYLNVYHPKEMKKLNKLLDEEVKVMKELYGDNSRHEQYKKNKLKDLKVRMGNAVIYEMKSYDRERRANYNQRFSSKAKSFRKLQRKGQVNHAIRNLQYHLKKTYQEYEKERNQNEFDRMLDENER